MSKVELFKEAKDAIFGPIPKNLDRAAGYNIAKNFYGPEIDRLEPILAGEQDNSPEFRITLKNIYEASALECYSGLPNDTARIFDEIGKRFRDR